MKGIQGKEKMDENKIREEVGETSGDGVVIDFEEAREERRRKRAEAAEKKKKAESGKASPKSARKKKQSMRAARRRLLLIALALVIILLAGFSAYNIIELREEKVLAQEQLDALEEEKARLEDELEHVNSLEYIEQKARQDLHMIFPDEYLYIVPDGDAQGAEE